MKIVMVLAAGAVAAAVALPALLLLVLVAAPGAVAGPSRPSGADQVPLGVPASAPSPAPGRAVADIPATMLALYVSAAPRCPGLSWTVLAAIGKEETDHGRGPEVSPAGAEGPMQFMPATWLEYGLDGDGDGIASIWDAADAVPATARYLCANGGSDPRRLASAIFQYNHDDNYVRQVLAWADRYAAAAAMAMGVARG